MSNLRSPLSDKSKTMYLRAAESKCAGWDYAEVACDLDDALREALSRLDHQLETNKHLLASREDLRTHLAEVQSKLQLAENAFNDIVDLDGKFGCETVDVAIVALEQIHGETVKNDKI